MTPKNSAPPKHARFGKTKSGTPRGRPRGPIRISALLREALEQRVDGDSTETRVEAIVMNFIDSALAGDKACFRRLLDALAALEPAEPEVPPHDCDDVIASHMYGAELSMLAKLKAFCAELPEDDPMRQRCQHMLDAPDPPPPVGVVWPPRKHWPVPDFTSGSEEQQTEDGNDA